MSAVSANPFRMFLLGVLTLSALAFSLDLFHMIYHLLAEPALFHIDGILPKLALKVTFLLLPLVFLFSRKQWQILRNLFFFSSLWLSFLESPAWALPPGCKHARELLDQSGVARDAHENFLGQVKIDPPTGTFPSDMDKISWWGEFKPFEFWESPQFQAAWINPQGEESTRQKFRGNKCRLAKDTVRAENQPRGEFQPGMWNVIVTCEDYVIDQKSFAVLPAGGSLARSQDGAQKKQEPAMIWAKDAVND